MQVSIHKDQGVVDEVELDHHSAFIANHVLEASSDVVALYL